LLTASRGLRAARRHGVRSVPDDLHRPTSRMGRSVSARRGSGSDEKPYANDPFYLYLTQLSRREHRASRKQIDSVRRQRRAATDPDHRDKKRVRRYGLTLEDYRALLARQGKACAICKKSVPRLCIDHCHATGKVRGLLCNKCNTGLGCYADDPKLTAAATAYLEAAQGVGGRR
jgi:hypothetical protein